MDKKDNVEIFEDDSIIQLFDDSNKPIDFHEIASIELDGKFYEILQPVAPMDGIGEDEAVILEYVLNEEKDEKSFKPIFDEALLNSIFDEYLRAVSDEGCGCGSCGGSCGSCGGDDDCDCGDDCDCSEDNDCGCGCGNKK